MAVRIATYNSGGLSADRRLFLNSIANSCDIILLQEHWLHTGCINDELNKLHDDYVGLGCSGMTSGQLQGPGRPYGGSAILYRSSMSHQITRHSCTIKNACSLKLNDTLVINTYLPGDNYSQTVIKDEYSDTLNNIEGMILNTQHVSLIIGGDFNTDLERDNAHSRYLKSFAQRHNLYFVKLHGLASYETTYAQYLNDGRVRQSCIDHILVSEDIFECITEIGVVESVDNPSYHKPLRIVYPYDINHVLSEPAVKAEVRPKIAWHRVTDEHRRNYQNIVTKHLECSRMPLSLFCNDPMCQNQ